MKQVAKSINISTLDDLLILYVINEALSRFFKRAFPAAKSHSISNQYGSASSLGAWSHTLVPENSREAVSYKGWHEQRPYSNDILWDNFSQCGYNADPPEAHKNFNGGDGSLKLIRSERVRIGIQFFELF